MNVHGEGFESATVELMRLDGYVLHERIGEGGMGVVYKAVDPRGRTVAVKLLKPQISADQEVRRRFAREARVLSRVRGNHVAEVLDADVLAETPYVVTRYVAGPSLHEVITNGGPLEGGDLADLAGDLADALDSIHSAGIVHRDLKPGNVLIKDGIAVVIDFGIAQFVDETRWTRTGLVYGTPGYVAPEVLSGGEVSEAADIHAWAATVAFAASGRSPFGSGPLEAVAYQVLHQEPDLSSCPAWLVPVLRRCLEKAPEDRPTATELLDWLELGKAPPLRRPDGAEAADGWSGAPNGERDGAQGGPAGAPTVPAAASAPAGWAAVPQQSPAQDTPYAAPYAGQYPQGQGGPWQQYDQAAYGGSYHDPAAAPQPPSGYASGYPGSGYPEQGYGEQGYAGPGYPGPAPDAQAGPGAIPAQADGRAYDPDSEPESARPRWTIWHSVVVVGLFAASGGLGGIAPLVALGLVVGWIVLARTVHHAARQLGARRDRRGGPAPSDSLVAITAMPWHFLRAAVLTVFTFPVALIGALCLVGLGALAAYAGVLPQRLDLFLGLVVACTGVLSWWGIGGANVREGSRAIVRWALPNHVMLVLGVCAAVVFAMLTLSAAEVEPLYWWPADAELLPDLPVLPDSAWEVLSRWAQ